MLSLALELGAITLVAALVGGIVGVAAAGPIVGHIDPLPDDPPAPALAIPLSAIAAGAIGLVVVAILASAFTSWLRDERTWERRCVSPERLVTCRALSKTYVTATGGIEALHSVDAVFAAGEVTAVVGSLRQRQVDPAPRARGPRPADER